MVTNHRISEHQHRPNGLLWFVLALNLSCSAYLNPLVNGKSCTGTKSSSCGTSGASAQPTFAITNRRPLVVTPGTRVILTGRNFAGNLVLTSTGGLGLAGASGGLTIPLEIMSDTQAAFTVPANAPKGQWNLAAANTANSRASVPVTFYVTPAAGVTPAYSGNLALICSDTQVTDATGQPHFGSRLCGQETVQPCASSGATGCIASADYPAAGAAGLAAKLVAGTQVGTITGTALAAPQPCSSSGQAGCVTSKAFPAVAATASVVSDCSSFGAGFSLMPLNSLTPLLACDHVVPAGARFRLIGEGLNLVLSKCAGVAGSVYSDDCTLTAPNATVAIGVIPNLSNLAFATSLNLVANQSYSLPSSMPSFTTSPYTANSNFLRWTLAAALPHSCREAQLNGQSKSGLYTVDPDGPGGIAPLQVYCDMSKDGGGWTLVAASNGTDTSDPIVASVPTTATAGMLSSVVLPAFASVATTVRITTPGYGSLISVDSYPINQLRQYLILNDDNYMGTPEVHWSGTSLGNMAYGCAVTNTVPLSTKIYHACGNGTSGLHWIPYSVIEWTWAGPTSNLNLWVR